MQETFPTFYPGNKQMNKTNSVDFSPQANYTDWATVNGRRILMTGFVDRGLSRGQPGGSSSVVILSFLDRGRYYFIHEAECTPFQTHCYSENLVVPGIEPGTSGLADRR
jgi:hypothetical protein